MIKIPKSAKEIWSNGYTNSDSDQYNVGRYSSIWRYGKRYWLAHYTIWQGEKDTVHAVSIAELADYFLSDCGMYGEPMRFWDSKIPPEILAEMKKTITQKERKIVAKMSLPGIPIRK